MKRNARNAFKMLQKMGAPVYEREEYGAYFVMGAELRTNDDVLFADYYGEEVREFEDENGRIVNAFGIREDVNYVMRKYDLFMEWVNPGMLAVYDA